MIPYCEIVLFDLQINSNIRAFFHERWHLLQNELSVYDSINNTPHSKSWSNNGVKYGLIRDLLCGDSREVSKNGMLVPS
jgi:hypothetical protein